MPLITSFPEALWILWNIGITMTSAQANCVVIKQAVQS